MTCVCLVVNSDRGYGKGTFAIELIGKGNYGQGMRNQSGAHAYMTDTDDTVGHFNTMSCSKLFINIHQLVERNVMFKSILVADARWRRRGSMTSAARIAAATS